MASLQRIIPVLTYQDIAAAHDFLIKAFGFNDGGVHRNADGSPKTSGSFKKLKMTV